MDILPSVIRATYEGDFRIRLTFHDNLEGTVDFRAWLEGPVFEPLKDRTYFKQFFIDGGTVAWPNGADIAPETLYDAVKRSTAAQQRAGADGAPHR
jgi:hypothetical protein